MKTCIEIEKEKKADRDDTKVAENTFAALRKLIKK